VKVEDYRNDIKMLLVRVDTRQEEMYHRISRIEKHLERLNGKIAEHEKKLTTLWSYGVAFVFIISISINLIMRSF
jgi:predicted  nucleic acid-binding Zn-ribbon protein